MAGLQPCAGVNQTPNRIGAQNCAKLTSIIEACKLNKIEPHAYLTGMLTAIAQGHKQKDIEMLLPWNFGK